MCMPTKVDLANGAAMKAALLFKTHRLPLVATLSPANLDLRTGHTCPVETFCIPRSVPLLLARDSMIASVGSMEAILAIQLNSA